MTPLTGRVMRMLAISGLCDEVGEEEYKANAVTRELAKPSWSDGLKYSYILPGFICCPRFADLDT